MLNILLFLLFISSFYYSCSLSKKLLHHLTPPPQWWHCFIGLRVTWKPQRKLGFLHRIECLFVFPSFKIPVWHFRGEIAPSITMRTPPLLSLSSGSKCFFVWPCPQMALRCRQVYKQFNFTRNLIMFSILNHTRL